MSAATDKNSDTAGTQGGSERASARILHQQLSGGGREGVGGARPEAHHNTKQQTQQSGGEKNTKLAPLSLHRRQGQLEAGGGAVWPVIKIIQNVPSGIGCGVLV